MGAIDRGRIPPSQTIPDHMDYPADHTPVIHARNATRPGGRISVTLAGPSGLRHIVLADARPPRLRTSHLLASCGLRWPRPQWELLDWAKSLA